MENLSIASQTKEPTSIPLVPLNNPTATVLSNSDYDKIADIMLAKLKLQANTTPQLVAEKLTPKNKTPKADTNRYCLDFKLFTLDCNGKQQKEVIGLCNINRAKNRFIEVVIAGMHALKRKFNEEEYRAQLEASITPAII